eukprot:1030496_1
MENTSPTSVESNTVIQNAKGDVVAIVTDIDKNETITNEQNNNENQQSQSRANTDILPPLIVETSDHTETQNAVTTNNDNSNNTNCDPSSRWSNENRVILKQLMGSLPPHDIGAALRVILDTFGVESSKLVRRGDFIELNLNQINDDYILDSLWNYCAQMQYNIMSTLQMQQQQQQQQQQIHYQQMHNYQQFPGQHGL